MTRGRAGSVQVYEGERQAVEVIEWNECVEREEKVEMKQRVWIKCGEYQMDDSGG